MPRYGFLEALTYLVGSREIDIVLGDMNTNDYCGYIVKVTDVMHSTAGNPYYDVQVKVAADKAFTVRFMLKSNSGVKRQSFEEKMENCEPVALKNLTLTDSGMEFFNAFKGSEVLSVVGCVDFQPDDRTSIDLIDLQSKDHGLFHICGQIKWTGPEIAVDINRKRSLEFTESASSPVSKKQ
eukprot:gene11551-12743_t